MKGLLEKGLYIHYKHNMETIEIVTPDTVQPAEIHIPGSKSYTNRALIMATLTLNPVIIKNALISDDTEAMISCLSELGIRIEKKGTDIHVLGDIRDVQEREYHLHARISGTTIRFIIALASVIPGVKHITGHEGLNKRPIGILVEGLRQLGADISYTDIEGYPPITINSNSFSRDSTSLHGDVSSQYFSALLMIAPAVGGLTIHVEGNQISKSYIDMTIDMMKEWGVRVINNDYKQYVIPQNETYQMHEYIVEGDYSGAGYFFAIAALSKSKLTLHNLNPQSAQGDRTFIHILEKMGNKIEYAGKSVTMIGNGVKPLTIDMEQCPDQAQTLSVLAAFADGVTTMTGVRSLRVKETERVKAVQQELAKMGIKSESPDEDTLIVYGGNPLPATIDTYGDHRMAMSFAVAGSVLKGMKINNPQVVQKTFPGYWDALHTIGIQTRYNY